MIGIQFVLNPKKNISHGYKQEIMQVKLLQSVMIATQNILWKCKDKIGVFLKKQFITQPTAGNYANQRLFRTLLRYSMCNQKLSFALFKK
jgi:hypothetical protein